MTDVEQLVREALARHEAEVPMPDPMEAHPVAVRARRRQVLNAAVGTLVGLAVLAGALAGIRTIQATPTPANTPTPTPTSPPTTRGVGSLAFGLDGDIYVADWDGSNALRIADGRPRSDCRGLGEYWGEGSFWSPDGRYLAYRHSDCDDKDAWWDVVISDPEGNVVTSFPGEGWLISWSPDSTRVAVWVRWGETIGVYGLDGERQIVLTVPSGWMAPGDFDPVWSPDGRSLLVPYDVVIPIDGSTPHRLSLADRHPGWLTYSPDGSRVAYSTHRALVVASADGSQSQELFGHSVFRPVWSPTGDRIAFTAGRQIGVVDVASGTVTILTEAGSHIYQAIDFSRDGDRILFSRTERRTDLTSLWSIRADGSDARRLLVGTFWGDWQPRRGTG